MRLHCGMTMATGGSLVRRLESTAPVRSDHPAYPYMDDRDGDGVVCE